MDNIKNANIAPHIATAVMKPPMLNAISPMNGGVALNNSMKHCNGYPKTSLHGCSTSLVVMKFILVGCFGE